MAEVDFMSVLHKSTRRNYLARVNDPDYPKAKAAELAKNFPKTIGMEIDAFAMGAIYLEGRWEKVARAIAEYYPLPAKPKILDIGCGKGFLLYDFLKVIPDAEIYGIDISEYAIANSARNTRSTASWECRDLPWEDNGFDLVISINTLHNLHLYDLDPALREMERVGKQHKYVRRKLSK